MIIFIIGIGCGIVISIVRINHIIKRKIKLGKFTYLGEQYVIKVDYSIERIDAELDRMIAELEEEEANENK